MLFFGRERLQEIVSEFLSCLAGAPGRRLHALLRIGNRTTTNMQHGDHQRRRKTSGMSPVLPQKATVPRRTFAYPAVNNTKNAGCLGLGRMVLLSGVIVYALSLLWMQGTLESSKSAVVNDTAASEKSVLIANAGKQESANIVAPGTDDNTPEHLQKIVQGKLNDLGLPPDATLELCRWLSTRSDAENARIRKACADSTAPPKVYYNALPRDRYVCGQKIASQAVTLLNQRCNDDDDDIATLFPVIPTVENADALPPVVLRFRKSNLGGKLFPGCNVPCRDYGIAEINTVRSVEVDSQTSWDFTFSMEGPEYYPFLEREPDAWRKNKFYATTSFDSEVPLPYYSKAEYSIQAPAVNYNDVIHGAAFLARNCGSKNNREDLVKQLQKSDFRIDSLSQCLHNAEPPPGVKLNGKKQLILRHYLFYLAFENQCVDDYITEKLWGPFEAGVVPIYFGAPNVKEHVPNHSIIHVDDFADTNCPGGVPEPSRQRPAAVRVVPRLAHATAAPALSGQVRHYGHAQHVPHVPVGLRETVRVGVEPHLPVGSGTPDWTARGVFEPARPDPTALCGRLDRRQRESSGGKKCSIAEWR